ncbi:hypothetical protein FEM48_Zijuj04G0171900 [Ziziphus jujuba var. spinosa]|uniref:Rx N-terminal domain-containing protein n=1 Tax=Ziziphus jujuba var. spinosa TaxID=714518 RepID=A0A978VL47_ZIZJJ|nr:hypothetical protein FEM48_Zijuj04G0171900 [Ziziphus jujuba var. spinosa]
MADSVVTSFMENLRRLVSIQEGNNWLLEANDQVKKLKDELNFIDDFLRASKNKRNENDEVEDAVDQITEAVLGAEDVLENYLAKLLKHSKWNLMVKVRDSSGLIRVLQDVTKKIRNVNNLINDIYGNTNKYGIVKAEEHEDEEHSPPRRRRNGDNDDDDGAAPSFQHDTTCLIPISEEMYGASTYQGLKDELHNYLNSKKYLIVLDNVWTTNILHEFLTKKKVGNSSVKKCFEKMNVLRNWKLSEGNLQRVARDYQFLSLP